MTKKTVVCNNCSEPILRHPSKTGKHFCNKFCKGAWQTKQREALGYTKEWLHNEYFTKQKSANQIAREIKRDPKRVWEWIVDYGMKLRPRGTDYGQAFKKGMPSAFKGKRHTQEAKAFFKKQAKADGRVPYLKNGEHWLKQAGVRPPSWRGGITPERNAFYASEEWAAAVKGVWRRDMAICQRCRKNHNTEDQRGRFHIHHIISFRVKSERSNIDNLVLLCAKCHRWVHSKKNINKEYIGRPNHG